MPSLFDPIQLGAVRAPNRILMAPLTRARCTRDHIPQPLMNEYYSQRASAGLIISEAVGISRAALGWPYAPGIWNNEQIDAWREITQSVHDAGGRIICQLWHAGRLVHPAMPGRGQPVSSSATVAPGWARTYEGRKAYTEARALEQAELPQLLEDYRRGARNAMNAGFDGVQIHGANGYLIDQFLRDSCNFRTDEYGGSVENRTRLLGEVVSAVASAVGAERTSVRLSPNGERQGANDSNPEPLFIEAARVLDRVGIAFLEVREATPEGTNGAGDHPPIAPAMRKVFSAPMVLNADYTLARAQAALDAGEADAISFGRAFIANPDLPYRLENRLKLATEDKSTWYTQGPEGYVDYPRVTTA